MKLSWGKYARISLVVYLALLATGLTIFFHGPFDYRVAFNEQVIEEPSFKELPAIESYEDLQKLVDINPAHVDNSNLTITPVDALHTTTPERIDVDMDSYTLAVDGLVARPLELTLSDIMAYPQTSEVVLLICPGFFADNAEWTGVLVNVLLTEAEIVPDASMVTFYGLDVSYDRYYQQTLPLEIISKEGVILAYQVNGKELPPEHGYPLRLVVKGSKGFTWVKWLWRIEVS
jgi:DMSO/TMAO reductase YedYZ molybdopterin-dependent catalytic subunit